MVERRLEGEVEVARQIIEGLLPRATPRIDGFDIAGVNETSYEVGGDYYMRHPAHPHRAPEWRGPAAEKAVGRSSIRGSWLPDFVTFG